jgi:lysophospholipase L1-like esterase
MAKPSPRRLSRTLIIIGVLAVVIIGLYLNRAYAYIYNEMGRLHLESSDNKGLYTINPAAASTSATTLVYAALGDSLTAGVGTTKYEDSYPYLVAQKLAGSDQRVVVQDLGIPGERTKGLLADVVPLANNNQPNIITVLIGVNDIHNQVSTATFRQNYDAILTQIAKNSTAQIYTISIPFIGANTLMLPPYQWYFDSRTREFNAIIQDLSRQHQVTYIDIYTPTENLFKQAGPHYSADLFHPSAAGYQVWAKIIYDSIHH